MAETESTAERFFYNVLLHSDHIHHIDVLFRGNVFVFQLGEVDAIFGSEAVQ